MNIVTDALNSFSLMHMAPCTQHTIYGAGAAPIIAMSHDPCFKHQNHRKHSVTIMGVWLP